MGDCCFGALGIQEEQPPLAVLLSEAHQVIPVALQRHLQSFRRRDEEIRLPGLNFLQNPRMNACHLGQLLLGQFFGNPQPS